MGEHKSPDVAGIMGEMFAYCAEHPEQLSRGTSTREIARKLEIKVHTVHKHRENLRRKLGITGSADLIVKGMQLIRGLSSAYDPGSQEQP